jgi:hypothetical protein
MNALKTTPLNNNILRFGIRPFLNQGETLSSYYYRLAKENMIDISLLLKFASLKNKTITRQLSRALYRVDTVLFNYLDKKILCNLIGKTVCELESNTLYFFNKKIERVWKKNNRIPLYNYKERFFCPLCIKNNDNIFKLEWQFTGVDCCLIHKCKLTSKCFHCNETQKYSHSFMAEGLCWKCNKVLSGKIEFVNNDELLQANKGRIDDILFLNNPKTNIYPFIPGLSEQQSISISLLYLFQKFSVIDKKDVNFNSEFFSSAPIKRGEFSQLICMFNAQGSISYSKIDEYLLKVGVSHQEFSKLKVPMQFIETFKKYLSRFAQPLKPACLFKFCRSYNSDKTMQLQNRYRITIKKTNYYHPYICMNCFMQYAYSYEQKDWICINNLDLILVEAKDRLNKGETLTHITKKMSISHKTFYQIIALLLRHNLLHPKVDKKFRGNVYEIDNSKLRLLFKDKEIRKGNKAVIMKKEGLTQLNLYYNYYSKEVQRNIFLKNKVNDELKQKLFIAYKKYLVRNLKLGNQITLIGFCKSQNISKKRLEDLGLKSLILSDLKAQRISKKQKKEKVLLKKLKEFSKLNSCRKVYIYEVCSFLGIQSKTIKSYPTLYKQILSFINQTRLKEREKKINELKKMVEKIITREMNTSKCFPKVEFIINELGVGDHFYNEYREVYHYFISIKNG